MNNPISPIRILPVDIAPTGAPGFGPAGAAATMHFLNTLQQSMEEAEGAQGDAANPGGTAAQRQRRRPA